MKTINYTGSYTHYGKSKMQRASALSELRKIEKSIAYRDAIMEGKKVRPTREEKIKNIEKWKKAKGLSTKAAICPKCKLPMNAKMAQTQKENKREGGVECMACIMGIPRRQQKTKKA